MSLRLLHNNPSGTTFNIFILGLTTTGETYLMQFENELTDNLTSMLVENLSPYPETYSTFTITTSGTTLDLGWYKYRIWTLASGGEDRVLLKTGQCYIYDEQGEPGNSPEITEYTGTKTKYVYKK